MPVWHLVREASFGNADDPASELSDIRGIEVSSNGNVLVLDFKAQNIHVFAPDGRFLNTLSRNGSGPGEFEEPNGFARAPDSTIWVNDPANHRFTVLHDDGTYIKDVRSELNSFGYVWLGYFDASGRMVNPILVPNAKMSASGKFVSDGYDAMLERRSMISNQADTVPHPACEAPDAAVHSWSSRSTRGGMVMGVPFQANQVTARSPQDFAWCTSGSVYTIYRLGIPRGDTLQVIHGSEPAVPVKPAERDSAVAQAKAQFVRSQLDPGVVKAGDIPRNKPVIIGLKLDDERRLWVRLTPAISGHTRYDIYNTAGLEIGTIDLPVEISEWPSVLIRGNMLYGVVRDQDDVPDVVRFRIE